MIPVTTFAGKKVAVFGLGGSGLAIATCAISARCRVSRMEMESSKRVST